ncbi:hypothetical protein DH2020_010968 [Rehmannia glutinosa]|uniref:Uncharacterized protein n=1 Tax=Rehmannia glutinosa TaxID=99300 RepID=A0ABR0XC18_REHGL
MAHHENPSLVLSFLLITLATTSGRVILADARNLLEFNFPEIPLPELPDIVDLPEPELPSLPKVELPHFPGLPEIHFPSLPTVEFPKIPDLSSFPQFPGFSKPGASAVHKDTPLSIQGLEMASAAGNRRLLTPGFPGFPTLPLPSFPTIPSPSLFPPLFPSPNPEDPETPSVPQFPPTTFPGNPSFPIIPPPSFTSP